MPSGKLHSEGMSYSPGADDSRVVLLFESPGVNEVLMNAPLSGLTGMRYCQIVRQLRELSKDGYIGTLRWEEFCKNNAVVINAYPHYSSIDHNQKVAYAKTRECVNSVAKLINWERVRVLICFGEAACSLYDEMKSMVKFNVPTVLKAWHISYRNSHCTDGAKHSKSNPLWRWQLNLLVRYICECSVKPGVFGWNKLREIDSKCQWRHKDQQIQPPEWIKEPD